MKICGSICEYNPLHKGHIKHIQTTKNLLNPDYLIVVMSGNFVQRGEMAILDKYTRAEMAIKAGADIVIELPTIFAISNAENFAYGGIKLLNDLKIVDNISFGSESGNIDLLNKFANFFLNESDEYKKTLNSFLKEGTSFPTAVTNTLKELFKNDDSISNNELQEIYTPNNILGIEYIKNLISLNSNISPITFKRENMEDFSSAHSIREAIYSNELNKIKSFVPDFVFTKLETLKNNLPNFNQLDLLIREKVYNLTNEELENIYDVSEGLHNRIKKEAFIKGETLDKQIKTKRYTLSKIKRILLNILFNISKDVFNEAKQVSSYAKILAINEDKKDILSIIKAKSDIHLLTRKSDYDKAENKDFYNILKIDILSNYIYSILSNTYDCTDDKLNGMKLIRGEKWKIEKNL